MTYLQQLYSFKDQEKSIALIGFGVEIKTFLSWLINTIQYPASLIYIADARELISLPEDIESAKAEQLLKQAYTGFSYLSVLEREDLALVFKAPGMWSLKPELEEYRNKNGSSTIHSCLIYFIEKYRNQIIGITGTKGKTTTSTLTSFLLDGFPTTKDTTIEAHYCGNTSNISPYQFWETKENVSTYFVVELSSYQLQDISFASISPHISMITNLLIDHQDQHKTPEEYWEAKESIFAYQQFKDFFFFSHQAYKRLRPNQGYAVDSVEAQSWSSMINSPLRGTHNAMNTALALNALRAAIEPEISTQEFILKHLTYLSEKVQNYKLPALRQELIRTIELADNKKIHFINDGAGTEAAAVAAAVKAYTSETEWVWLFMNGRDKGSDTSILHETLTKLRNQIFKKSVSGAVGNRIVFEGGADESSQTLAHSLPNTEEFNQLIREWSSLHPEKSNILNIIFSPGGSSFDEYDNYIARGKAWSEWANSLEITDF